MNNPDPSRRQFISTAVMLSAASALSLPASSLAQLSAAKSGTSTRWPIGCHGRPFREWHLSQDGILDAIQAAGYRSADMIGSEWLGGWARTAKSTPEYLAAVKAKLIARGMVSTVDYFDVPAGTLDVAYAAARKQVDAAQTLGQGYLISMGTYREDEWVRTCRVLSYASAYGQDRGVQIAVKPHDGLNRTALELLGWLKQVNHPNFGLFYDAGNIVYYTGKDPVAQLELIAPFVTGVVAKDCLAPQFMERRAGDPGFGSQAPNPHGNEVLIQFGTGKVDFAGMFRKLNAVGFRGPVMVEGVAVGATLEETIANARSNREYLERTFAQL